MMVEIAAAIKIALSLLDLIERGGVNLDQLMVARKRAKNEGRDLTDEELESFATDADAAIERARNA